MQKAQKTTWEGKRAILSGHRHISSKTTWAVLGKRVEEETRYERMEMAESQARVWV